MRVTVKGQVTIPKHIRRFLNIGPGMEVDFITEDERVFLVKKEVSAARPHRFQRLRGAATVKMTTDEIMALTRGD